MKGALNIYRDNFLEKEELDRLMSFIKDNPALFLFISSTQSFGIIQQGLSLAVDPAFKVEVGTNSNSLKITTDSYALDKNGNLMYLRAFDNLPIPTVDSTWYWMKIYHRYDNYEQGFVDIAVDGTLSGVSTVFTAVLRGASSGFPVKLQFFTQADDGSLTPATNSGIYEVVSVASDNTAVIAGNLSAETHLRYVVLGAFSIKTSVAAITSTGIYSYDSCQVDFVTEAVSDTPPAYTSGEEFYIARVNSDGATVTIQDQRSLQSSYFRINFGDIVISGKADANAGNLTAPNIAAWLAALAVYTSSQVDSLVAGYLAKSQNLNDLQSKSLARSNLDVYSTESVDTAIAALGTFSKGTSALTMETGTGPTYTPVTPSATIWNVAKIGKMLVVNFSCYFQFPGAGTTNHLFITFGAAQGTPQFASGLVGAVILFCSTTSVFQPAAIGNGYAANVLDVQPEVGNYANSTQYILNFSCVLPLS
jgi:hypothetical protein